MPPYQIFSRFLKIVERNQKFMKNIFGEEREKFFYSYRVLKSIKKSVTLSLNFPDVIKLYQN